MTDEPLDRLDALDLAVTQLADAVEVLAQALASATSRRHLEPVLQQIANVRELLGTGD